MIFGLTHMGVLETQNGWKIPVQIMSETTRPLTKKIKRQHGQTEKWSEPISKKFNHIQEINEMLLNASETTVEFVRNLLKNP